MNFQNIQHLISEIEKIKTKFEQDSDDYKTLCATVEQLELLKSELATWNKIENTAKILTILEAIKSFFFD